MEDPRTRQAAPAPRSRSDLEFGLTRDLKSWSPLPVEGLFHVMQVEADEATAEATGASVENDHA